jgi:hypothetical protein
MRIFLGVKTVKRNLTLILVLLSMLVLTACGTAQAVNAPADNGQAFNGTPVPGANNSSNGQRNLSPAMKLALGIFKLDGTDHPVSAQQAKDLLPLWKALRSLGSSQTTAQEELQAVVKQIQGTLTSEQAADIDAMQLTFRDLQTVAQEHGFESGFGGQSGNFSPEARATFQAARQSGQAPPGAVFVGPGGFPGEGGPPGQGGLSPEVRQTAIARGGTGQRSGLGLPPALLDAIIKFLGEKAK